MRTNVESSNLAWIDYDRANQVLMVMFRTEAIYEYVDVPPEVFSRLLQAESKGKFFGKEIRTRFKYRKI